MLTLTLWQYVGKETRGENPRFHLEISVIMTWRECSIKQMQYVCMALLIFVESSCAVCLTFFPYFDIFIIWSLQSDTRKKAHIFCY